MSKETLIQSQQVTLTGPDWAISGTLQYLRLRAKVCGCTVTIHTPSVTDATVGVTEDSQQNPRQWEESMDEQGWLIERGGLCLGLQCGGPAWVAFTDPNAIRFAREIDAKNMLSGLRKFGETNGAFKDCIVTGHMWVGPPDAQGSVTEPPTEAEPRDDGPCDCDWICVCPKLDFPPPPRRSHSRKARRDERVD